MDATILQLRRPREAIPLPDAMVLVCETLGLPLPPPWEPIGYTLERSGHGTIVGLCQGGHWWNLSALSGEHYPPSFAEARKWIAAYAARHGTKFREMRYDRGRHEWVFTEQRGNDG